jgi:hypothetical protein
VDLVLNLSQPTENGFALGLGISNGDAGAPAARFHYWYS